MKKIVIALAALVLTAGFASAQDINTATQTYNDALAQVDFDKPAALAGLQEALQQGELLGEEGAELVANCKTAIPSLVLSIAKGQIKDSKFDEAFASLALTDSLAKAYGNEDILWEVPDIVVDLYNRKGSKCYNEKNWEGTIECLTKVIEAKPEDGNAYIKLAVANQALGKIDEALELYKKAAENGKEKQVASKIANIYKKKAITAQKSGKYADAIEALATSNEYVQDAGNFRSIGGLYAKQGKLKDANEAYIKYLELNPAAADADGVRYTIAVNAQKLGDKVTAKTYYTQLLKSGNPDYVKEAQKQLLVIR